MPTLNLSSAAAPSGLPSLLAASLIAPASTGDGAGDAFAAMLAGLTAVPAEGAAPTPTVLPPTAAALPQARQDPAAWLPDEAVELPGMPALSDPVLPPVSADQPKLRPLKLDVPDCEMPAELDGLPLLPGIRASLPETVVHPVSKVLALRLSSALTPARSVPELPTGEQPQVSQVKTAEQQVVEFKGAEPASTGQPQAQAPIPPMPSPPAQPVAAADPPPPSPTSDGDLPHGEAPGLLPRSAAPAQMSTGALPSQTTRPEVWAAPQFAETSKPATIVSALSPEPNLSAPSFAPELLKQIERAIEAPAQSSEPRPAEAASAPAQLAPASAPPPMSAAPQAQSAPAPNVVQPAPVDVGRAEWVQAMVDRIAELPQAEGKREAQISLLPAALGKIDVSIVQRDEQIQVTLNAETVQARQLLAEAAPRLQDMAEARGLRLAEPQVGGGQPQDRRGAQDQQQPQTSDRPRSASAASDNDPQPHGDLIA